MIIVTDPAALYRESRERIAALVREASEEQRARAVPGCPKWTVSDTVAHLAANAADEVAGRLTGVPSDEQTAAQVEQRRGRSLAEILAEWDGAAEPLEPFIAAHPLAIAWVNDVLTHEADIRGALGAGRPPEAAWTAALELARPVLVGRLGHLGELTILAGEHRFTVGSGEPATTVEVDTYEFWRSLLGRRSRAQMAAWPWSGDPEPYLQAIPRFGPTEVALTEPADSAR
ncbi:MAG: maleylpyruvate isomerase family mycothiol-dependent enzyme [Pseudonocardiaceae bacterium]